MLKRKCTSDTSNVEIEIHATPAEGVKMVKRSGSHKSTWVHPQMLIQSAQTRQRLNRGVKGS